jgi:hypothetical protein
MVKRDKMKKLTAEEVVNAWLKYHGKTVQDVLKELPNSLVDPSWFDNYQVTKEQHQEWREWVIKELKKRGIPAHKMGFIDLQYGPKVCS